jgi:hypothetical protein
MFFGEYIFKNISSQIYENLLNYMHICNYVVAHLWARRIEIARGYAVKTKVVYNTVKMVQD